MIRLFAGADTSTFMHEMIHHYLSELKKMSERFPQSEAAKDYATIMEWAEWKDGQMEAYAGTLIAYHNIDEENLVRAAQPIMPHGIGNGMPTMAKHHRRRSWILLPGILLQGNLRHILTIRRTMDRRKRRNISLK